MAERASGVVRNAGGSAGTGPSGSPGDSPSPVVHACRSGVTDSAGSCLSVAPGLPPSRGRARQPPQGPSRGPSQDAVLPRPPDLPADSAVATAPRRLKRFLTHGAPAETVPYEESHNRSSDRGSAGAAHPPPLGLMRLDADRRLSRPRSPGWPVDHPRPETPTDLDTAPPARSVIASALSAITTPARPGRSPAGPVRCPLPGTGLRGLFASGKCLLPA